MVSSSREFFVVFSSGFLYDVVGREYIEGFVEFVVVISRWIVIFLFFIRICRMYININVDFFLI